jgi:hypothetical protein
MKAYSWVEVLAWIFLALLMAGAVYVLRFW